jgi:hypothetical protein
MDIVGDRKYVEVSGEKTHELPPLLVRSTPGLRRPDQILDQAAGIVEFDDMISALPAGNPALDLEFERRRMDLAINLLEQYRLMLTEWKWGDSILEWIRQCEATFETRPELRNLLRPDVWPHAGRSSFVVLLEDKSVPAGGVDVEGAVGLRLTFREPPPISCFSNQFLFYLKATVASTAYHTWAKLSTDPISSLPPERFHFEVVDMAA